MAGQPAIFIAKIVNTLYNILIELDIDGKRSDEQIVTGTINDNNNGTFTMTNRGHLLLKLFRFIGKLYNANMKNIQ